MFEDAAPRLVERNAKGEPHVPVVICNKNARHEISPFVSISIARDRAPFRPVPYINYLYTSHAGSPYVWPRTF